MANRDAAAMKMDAEKKSINDEKRKLKEEQKSRSRGRRRRRRRVRFFGDAGNRGDLAGNSGAVD